MNDLNIEFDWNEYREHDDSWDELVVRVDGGTWSGTMANYGSEDEDEVIAMILLCDKILTEVIAYNEVRLKSGLTIFEPIPANELAGYDTFLGYQLNGITVLLKADYYGFTVGYMQYDIGSYWEPPSYDYIEYGDFDTIKEAFECAEALSAKFHNQTENEVGYCDDGIVDII